jgi:hypothetical protein
MHCMLCSNLLKISSRSNGKNFLVLGNLYSKSGETCRGIPANSF